jgi:hypothetical protein
MRLWDSLRAKGVRWANPNRRPVRSFFGGGVDRRAVRRTDRGVVFLALTSAGLAAEVAVPSAIVTFDDLTVTDHSQPFCRYSQIGEAALIFADRLHRLENGCTTEVVGRIGGTT